MEAKDGSEVGGRELVGLRLKRRCGSDADIDVVVGAFERDGLLPGDGASLLSFLPGETVSEAGFFSWELKSLDPLVLRGRSERVVRAPLSVDCYCAFRGHTRMMKT